jgi:hypothetical protein
MGGYLRRKLEPHREFLEAPRTEEPDITPQALCDRLLAERGVRTGTSMRAASSAASASRSKKDAHWAGAGPSGPRRHRTRWRTHQKRVDPSRVVFIDET